MTQNTLSFVQFLLVALVLSALAHSLSRALAVAAALSAFGSAAITIAWWSIRQGYFDGWYFISAVTLSAWGAVISLAVGFVFRHWRRRAGAGVA